ncbi:MAG: leucine-rich repeat domain-containing protein [Prevotella sp.]|nr:leucine-rich repeat domain-containing protein [Prevotella sp.]
MDKRIVLITIAELIATTLSCTNKTTGQQGKQQIETDTVAIDSVVELDSMSPYWYDKDQTEVTFSEKKDTLYRFPRIKMGGTYSIPYTVRYIQERAFLGCKELEEVYVPRSVNHIEMAAFESCHKLESVYLYASIDTIPFRCFNHCDHLRELHLGNPKPPYIEEFSIDGVNNDSCVLYVPKGAKGLYRKSEGWKDFKNIEEEENSLSVYKKPVGNGQYRDFFITYVENGYRFMVYDSSKDKYHDIDFNADDYLNGGVPGISAFTSPDGRYVYVVGDILANSTGWVCTLIIYQVDTKTLKAKFVNGVAAWRLEKDGFTVASETRCTTPEAEFSYQMDFAFEDITYGFDGKVKHKSKEYPSQEVEPRYGKNNNAVIGLGVIRHSFYDVN